jgi:hypothetical protein
MVAEGRGSFEIVLESRRALMIHHNISFGHVLVVSILAIVSFGEGAFSDVHVHIVNQKCFDDIRWIWRANGFGGYRNCDRGHVAYGFGDVVAVMKL